MTKRKESLSNFIMKNLIHYQTLLSTNISRFLGHANINTTLVYAKLSETDVNEKLKRWNSEYWGEYMGDPIDEDELDTMTDEQRNLSKIFGRK